MQRWVFGVALMLVAVASPVRAQDTCPPSKAFRLISSITPVIGKSPLWVTTGSAAIPWDGPNNPIQALWIRDLAAKGPAILGGKLKGGTAPARFARAALGMPEERFKFDLMGEKPSSVKPDDLQKYSFHRTFIWFPAAGCYEMTARVGPVQSIIYLNVGQGTGKTPQVAKKPSSD